MNKQNYIDHAEQALLHTYNRFPVVLDHGEGVYLYDTDGKKYLDFAAELKKVKKKDRKSEVDHVLKLVKLEEVEGRLIKNLSKGYKQRVGLAQAVLGFPEVIILDEPTVGLDPKQIIEIRELIKELSKNHTIVLSSHILAEVQAVCDYVMIIAHGKLVASDTPENLERLLNGSETIELTAKAEETRVREILSKIEEIETVDYKEQHICRGTLCTTEVESVKNHIGRCLLKTDAGGNRRLRAEEIGLSYWEV